jgi:two-component system, NarL family, nitrate/nitrite response regulator NarL
MTQAVAAMIVAQASAFRDALESNLRCPGFRIITSTAKLSDIGRGELPESEPYLIVIECSESPGLHTAQVAALRQQNPLARIALVGQRWTPADIANAFEAGANAYFAEAAATKEFMQAMNLITR